MLAAGSFGAGIPLVLMAAFWLRALEAGDWLIYVWPTAFMLMATETLGHSAQGFEILGFSILYNVVLYALVFLFFWCVAWVFRAWRASLRDGTTI